MGVRFRFLWGVWEEVFGYLTDADVGMDVEVGCGGRVCVGLIRWR